MNGMKSKAAGIGMMLTGLGMIGAALGKEGGFDFAAIQTGAQTFFAGLAILGVAHKLSKLPQA